VDGKWQKSAKSTLHDALLSAQSITPVPTAQGVEPVLEIAALAFPAIHLARRRPVLAPLVESLDLLLQFAAGFEAGIWFPGAGIGVW
jgi:hypothetical protein